MKTTKIIRYMGLCLLILSVILLTYLYSYTFLKEIKEDSKKDSSGQYAVIEIYTDSSRFPQNDFDILFSKLKLDSDSVQIDLSAPAEVQQSTISAAIEASGSAGNILFAWKDACLAALEAARSNPGIASAILLSPNITGNAAVETFGTHQPNLPLAIFDLHTPYSTSLYERLSGEDASLFPGLKEKGVLTPVLYISPDGSRYLSQWDLPLQTGIAQPAIPFLPQVQIDIGKYITTYAYDMPLPANKDIGSAVAFHHIIRILAVTFLIGGLLMFFASMPRPDGDGQIKNTRKKLAERTRENTAGTPEGEQEAAMCPTKADPARGRAFLASSIASVVFAASIIIMYSVDLRVASTILAGWPILYYACGAVVFMRCFPRSLSRERVAARRIWFSVFLALLFAYGVFVWVLMYYVSAEEVLGGIRGFILILFLLLLFFFVWIRMSADFQPVAVPYALNSSRAVKTHSWYQHSSIVFPYVFVMAYLLATGKTVHLLHAAILLAALLACIWIRFIFRRISGTKWLAALVFSAIYSIIAFG